MLDHVRFADEKTLHLIARFAAQKRELLFGFHPFAEDWKAETVSERDDGASNV